MSNVQWQVLPVYFRFHSRLNNDILLNDLFKFEFYFVGLNDKPITYSGWRTLGETFKNPKADEIDDSALDADRVAWWVAWTRPNSSRDVSRYTTVTGRLRFTSKRMNLYQFAYHNLHYVGSVRGVVCWCSG